MTKIIITAFFAFVIASKSTSIVMNEGRSDNKAQGYSNYDNDMKCIVNSEYIKLKDSFIRLVVAEIERNNTIEAVYIFNAVAPEDTSPIEKIVEYTVNRLDFQLIYLLQFICQIRSPIIRLHGFSCISRSMNENGTSFTENVGWFSSDDANLLDWLNLEYFASKTFSEYKNIEVYKVLLSEIQFKAKNVASTYENYTILQYFDSYNSMDYDGHHPDRFEPHHLSLIIENYLYDDPQNIRKVIEFLNALQSPLYQLTGFIDLYNKIESISHLNETFVLIPVFKYFCGGLSDYEYSPGYDENKPQLIEKVLQKVNNSSLMKNILSDELFLIKNVYNKGYLFHNHNKRISTSKKIKKSSNLLRTISNSDSFSEYINWKFVFTSDTSIHKNQFLLQIVNANNGNCYEFLPVYCDVHDHSVVKMVECYSSLLSWNIETDDFFGDTFRIKYENTGQYLSVTVGNESRHNEHLPTNVLLVSNINADNYDSVHWTLEPVN